MKIKELENKLGTLSKPSKMPGFSFQYRLKNVLPDRN